MFSDKEIKLAQYFMERASEELGNNSCNDVEEEVWQEWTLEERKKFIKDYHEWNGDPEDYDDEELHLPDFAVMSFLSSKLERFSKCNVTVEELCALLIKLNSHMSRQLDDGNWYVISSAIVNFINKKGTNGN